jgi:hypothetical protein
VGSGTRFVNHGWAGRILGNWETTAIFDVHSGLPFTVTSSEDYSNTDSESPRPDRICNGAGPKTLAAWFNTSCFTTQALEEALAAGNPRFGNSGRNILSGPHYDDLDFALMKNFSIKERAQVQFRAEAYDLLNAPDFGIPDSVIGTSGAGIISSAGNSREIQFGLKVLF